MPLKKIYLESAWHLRVRGWPFGQPFCIGCQVDLLCRPPFWLDQPCPFAIDVDALQLNTWFSRITPLLFQQHIYVSLRAFNAKGGKKLYILNTPELISPTNIETIEFIWWWLNLTWAWTCLSTKREWSIVVFGVYLLEKEFYSCEATLW